MKIVVPYKWTCDPEEATARADGTVDWSRARPGVSTYDPVAIELARGLAQATGAELIGVTVGAKGVGAAIASKAVLSRGLDRVVVVEDDSLKDAGRADIAAVLAAVVGHIGDVDLVSPATPRWMWRPRWCRPRWPAARLAGGGRGHRGDRPARHAACRARDPGRPADAGDLRSRRAGGLRRCRDPARARHEGSARGGQEAGGALDLASLKVPARSAVVTVTSRSRPGARPARAR